MMRSGMCAVMLTLVACDAGKEGATGPQGERGSPGAQGERGPQGEPGSAVAVPPCNGLYYVDAAGSVVAPICAPYILDPQGYTWGVNKETGQLTYEGNDPGFIVRVHDLVSSVYFESDDCTGTPYMTFPVAPRMPFPVKGRYRVREDEDASSLRRFRSNWQEDGSCYGLPAGAPPREWMAFPLGPERELTPPPDFQGPLHIERRL